MRFADTLVDFANVRLSAFEVVATVMQSPELGDLLQEQVRVQIGLRFLHVQHTHAHREVWVSTHTSITPRTACAHKHKEQVRFLRHRISFTTACCLIARARVYLHAQAQNGLVVLSWREQMELPVQHLMEEKALVQEVVNCTPQDHWDFSNTLHALAAATEVHCAVADILTN